MALEEAATALQESHDQAHVSGSRTEVALVVCLGPAYTDAPPEQIVGLLSWLQAVVQGARGGVMIGYPVTQSDTHAEEHNGMVLQPFVQTVASSSVVVQTAAAWLNAYEMVRAHGARGCLLLGAEADTLDARAVGELIGAVVEGGADLAVPRYDLSSNQGLLNAALMSPLSRAIFNADLRFPLALDFACSARMAERMAGAAQRLTTAGQGDAIVWPVGEAAVAGFVLAEVPTGPREIPQITDDLGSILNRVAGSMFGDVEAKATFWQRTRPPASILRNTTLPVTKHSRDEAPSQQELAGLVESFRIGYNNLHEIWSLVLPPNTLVALKRLSAASVESFHLPDSTWVRIVYDFVLAHRLRTIARNHLMGAFTPLYLAWVASHLVQSGGVDHTEQLARAFEADKPYLVSRWRWPDRFNP